MSHKTSKGTYVALHFLVMLFSLSSVCSKMASKEAFLSLKFCVYYGLVLTILGVYAIFWQQIIKRISLTAAYANKAVTVVWGLIWGILIFREQITFSKIAGCVLIVAGVILFAMSGGEKEEAHNE